MNLALLLKSLFQSAHTVGQELLLVFVLLLDVRIYSDGLHRLVLHILEQRVSDSTLKLVEVIDILNYPVDGSFEALDVAVILTDQHAVALINFMQLLLLVF